MPERHEVSQAGFGHFTPSQPCFSSCLIFLRSREGRGDVCPSRGQNRMGEDLPAQSPAEQWPANGWTFCFKATCDFCVALRLGHPSFFFKLGHPVQHLSKLVASMGRRENKVMIHFLITFQPLPPPHPCPFAIW